MKSTKKSIYPDPMDLTDQIISLEKKIEKYEKYLIILNCKQSLRFEENNFNSCEYVDTCHCKQNLNYVISTLRSGEATPERWKATLLRNKEKGVPECGHIWLTEGL